MRSFLQSLAFAILLLIGNSSLSLADNFGLTGREAEQQAPSGIGDLFKGEGEGDATAPQLQLPAGQPAADVAAKPIQLTYDGQAAADGRRARIDLSIALGGQVSGTIWIQSVCETNIHLGGADLTFTGQLSGTWESKDASIDAQWSGTEHFCGTDQPNNGVFKFFLKGEGGAKPVLHLRITGQRGRYGWNFPPTNRVYATGSGTSAPDQTADGSAAPGTDKPETGTAPPDGGQPPETDGTSNGDTETAGESDGDIDPDRVTGIVMLPQEVVAAPGGMADRPTVFAIMGDTADKIAIPDGQIEWETAKGLELKDGRFRISSNAKPRDRIGFKATVKLSLSKRFESQGAVRVTGGRLGSISGKVYMFYRYPYNPGAPNPLVRATVELQPNTGGAALRRTTTGSSGEYTFDGLPEGSYRVFVTGIEFGQIASGYRMKKPNGPWMGEWAWIPQHKSAFKPDPDTAKWDHKGISTEIELIGPDYDAAPDAVSGRVIYKGQGVSGVTVMANRVGTEEGEKRVVSGKDGRYSLPIKGLPDGTYWLRAEKYVVPRWAGPDDLLDIASTRDERSVLFTVPFFGVDRIEQDIEVLTRHEIFGGERGPEQPEGLP